VDVAERKTPASWPRRRSSRAASDEASGAQGRRQFASRAALRILPFLLSVRASTSGMRSLHAQADRQRNARRRHGRTAALGVQREGRPQPAGRRQRVDAAVAPESAACSRRIDGRVEPGPRRRPSPRPPTVPAPGTAEHGEARPSTAPRADPAAKRSVRLIANTSTSGSVAVDTGDPGWGPAAANAPPAVQPIHWQTAVRALSRCPADTARVATAALKPRSAGRRHCVRACPAADALPPRRQGRLQRGGRQSHGGGEQNFFPRKGYQPLAATGNRSQWLRAISAAFIEELVGFRVGQRRAVLGDSTVRSGSRRKWTGAQNKMSPARGVGSILPAGRRRK